LSARSFQAALSQQGNEKRRLRQIVIEGVRFVEPCEAGIHRQARTDAPDITSVETIEIEDTVGTKATLGHPGRPDDGLETSQGKREHLVHVVEESRERNRGVALTNHRGRPDHDLSGLDRRRRDVAVLPLEAETQTVIAFVPDQTVRQLIATADVR
jgi:hypothetical protein